MKYNGLMWPAAAAVMVLLVGAVMTACSSGDGNDSVGNDNNGSHGPISDGRISAPGGQLKATIRTTTGGVPHIRADNLESAGFGSGYVQARDNVCIIADSILRARGERARFYGPGPENINVITDFSYKALGLLDKADQQFDQLSPESQAMLRGFAAGYNKYVNETDSIDLPGKCAGQPWVRAISPQDLYAYYQLIALYASGDQFTTGVTFSAVPPGVDPTPAAPVPSAEARSRPQTPDFRRIARRGTPQGMHLKTDYNERRMASNGWGIGADMTENGKGALLANPHFPYTGNRRLYQSQITVPGVYNVNGASLIGFVVPLIGFNENIAWTHTVSTAQHFTLYELTLKAGDNLTYIKNGKEKPITQKQITVEVANGTPTPTTLARSFYYSEYGPMLAANRVDEDLPAWGDSLGGRPIAFTYRDANADTARQAVDQWLAMGRANNLEQFKKPFENCGSVLWANTIYSDARGQAFYIDGTSVPRLSERALSAYQERVSQDLVVAALAANGVTLLDGSRSINDWVEGDCGGRVAYSNMPRLTRRDYVQNSNDSYWATNPNAFLTGYSPLYGPTESMLSPRTRMGMKMLENPTDPGLSDVQPAGNDGRFNGEEIINTLYSNRAYYAEELLGELKSRCENAGDTPIVTADNNSRTVAAGCTALAGWNGVYDIDSRGAQVFRVFMANYDPQYPSEFSEEFDPSQPETTPGTPKPAPADPARDPMLAALAAGLNALDQVDIAYDAALGDIQYQQQSASVPPADFPNQPSQAAASGPRIPWHGNQNLEGGFNIVRPVVGDVGDGTRFPRVSPATLDNTGDLSSVAGEGWRIAYGTSWHFGLHFSDDGPQGYGLVSYSQSDDPSSDHFSDQDQRYSAKNYRKLLYSDADIEADENLETETITATIGKSDGARR